MGSSDAACKPAVVRFVSFSDIKLFFFSYLTSTDCFLSFFVLSSWSFYELDLVSLFCVIISITRKL